MDIKTQLLKKFNDKKATIGIFGLGYVGLPLAIRFVQVGFKVIGFDINTEKVDQLNKSSSFIDHIPDRLIQKINDKGFKATSDFAEVQNADALIICVPTPLDKNKNPDLSYVIETTKMISSYIREGHVFSLESTTYPGTTDEVVQPILESSGLKVGEEIFLVYSPEREDPGNQSFTTSTIPKVISGITPNCLEIAESLYDSAVNNLVPVSSTRAAEMTKLLENIHRAVNIGLVNEVKIVADAMDIDIHEVIEAASTKPFGFTPYYPGPGLGGHCIPIDPFYFTWRAKHFGLETKFIELAGEVNNSIPGWVVNKLNKRLVEEGKVLNGSKVLLLGLAYKKDIGDMRESPTFKFIDILENEGCNVDYCDPHIPVLGKTRDYNFNKKSIELNAEKLSTYDAAILVTDHSSFDYDLICKNSKILVDTRGVYKEHRSNVIRA